MYSTLLAGTSGHGGPPPETLRPSTPVPDASCSTLHRTISYASIDTIRPSSKKGVRRRITEIADNLKHKSAKKKKKALSTYDAPKNVAQEQASNSRASPASKTREDKATTPLQDSSHRSEQGILAIAESIHCDVLSGRLSPSMVLSCKSEQPITDRPLAKENGQAPKDCSFLIRSLNLGANLTDLRDWAPRTCKIDIKDVQLGIHTSESNVTIWDGLQVVNHLFKCKLYLRCTTHPYDAVSLPDIRRIKMNCNTYPVASRYARPPVLQASYEGVSSGLVTGSSELSEVKPAAGIHMDPLWRKTLEKDGTWGWCREAFVPLTPRLFDKMDYREFKLASQVWIGESSVEAELTFGISMLLRAVDMK